MPRGITSAYADKLYIKLTNQTHKQSGSIWVKEPEIKLYHEPMSENAVCVSSDICLRY